MNSWSNLGLSLAVVTTYFGIVCSTGIPYDYEPISIRRGPEDARVKQYGMVIFYCEVSGNPAPSNVYWRKSGLRVDPGSYQYSVVNLPGSTSLMIDPVMGESTIVDCVAESDFDGSFVTSSASLVVYQSYEVPNGFPEIIVNPALSVLQEEGRAVILECEAEGDPSPSYTWYKNQVPIVIEDPLHSDLIQIGGTLLLFSVDRSDAGMYECAAENDHGLSFSSYSNLRVTESSFPPYFIITPDSVRTVPRGSSTVFSCVAAGNPTPAVRWRQGTDYLSPEGAVSLGYNILTVSNIQQPINYTCEASSTAGTVEADVQLIVEDTVE